ncbi:MULTISPECIES: leucine efflux protein LeuE [unclassified Photobacterium]|uniref:leucine efflux protein LeuE n=1 Tax=unclassified Photobacterium TaxID=2628852 RepID=UPI001B8BEC67|nr:MULTISPECIES: leucine efflux protein LeuE [unclassified Photobacterium]MDO6706057.1 leucine efflux protein LeuE [Photobacterium sp. 1_MG-2023]QUJ69411.1 leucine efflux protein LeuE [Photobacterium sp. GJ3]
MFADYGVLNFWAYVAGAMLIVLLPGPNSLFVLKTGMTQGIRQGYMAALAVFLGDAILMFFAYAGVATLIQTTPILFTLVRYLGAIYLLFIGSKIVYSAFKPGSAETLPETAGKRVFRKALILSLTNPKAILFYVSFFVQFIDTSYHSPGVSFFILAAVLELFSLIFLSALIFGGAYITRLVKASQRVRKLGNTLMGTLFIGFAARLALSNA